VHTRKMVSPWRTQSSQRKKTYHVLVLSVLSVCSVVSIALAEPPKPKFEKQTIDDAIRIGYGLATGDVDGDGKTDILLADAHQIVWYRSPDWQKFVIAENLTERDHVCLTARDINGDGRVELAVGAQWNPGNTSDPEQSGAVFYLIRPDDPTQKWDPVQIKPHEPTVHRMHWVRTLDQYKLAVLPLHGVGNRGGEGEPVNLLVYDMPDDPRAEWKLTRLHTGLHQTHNFDVVPTDASDIEFMVVAGTEALRTMDAAKYVDFPIEVEQYRQVFHQAYEQARENEVDQEGYAAFLGAGEVRYSNLRQQQTFMTAIEPMHGDFVTVYRVEGLTDKNQTWQRSVLDGQLKGGHALAVDDLLKLGRDQIVAGWRQPNDAGKVGIRLYVPDAKLESWTTHTIDDNTMACEDLKVVDLDGDGRLDIVASGRATKNVVIYWNRSDVPEL